MSRPREFTKVNLKPKRWHFYAVFLFILGTLLPPLAVAARFGIGKDFWLNLVLTICGYIPGHVHNFYIQNVRNNKNNRRTPKWASRYGLVDTSSIERKKKKSQWASRYNDRLPASTLDGRPVEEGEVPTQSLDTLNEDGTQPTRPTLWNQGDESYYNRDGSSASVGSRSSGRWRYPANFDDADPVDEPIGKKKKKDRWARTEDARMGVGMESGKKKKKKKRRAAEDNGDFINPDRRSSYDSSTLEGPEDPEGRSYGPSRTQADPVATAPAVNTQRDPFEHEF